MSYRYFITFPINETSQYVISKALNIKFNTNRVYIGHDYEIKLQLDENEANEEADAEYDGLGLFCFDNFDIDFVTYIITKISDALDYYELVDSIIVDTETNTRFSLLENIGFNEIKQHSNSNSNIELQIHEK